MARRADRPEGAPTLTMVLAGGVGVVVAVAFVAGLALGSRPERGDPGDRLGLARASGPTGLAVVAPRCRGERVDGVELSVPDGPSLWRITSRKGSIDERYVVGGEPLPLGFDLAVPLAGPLPAGPVVVTVNFDRSGVDAPDMGDRVVLDPAAVPEEGVLHQRGPVPEGDFEQRALGAAACPDARSDLGPATVAFAAAAAAVVVTYVFMVGRWWRARRT